MKYPNGLVLSGLILVLLPMPTCAHIGIESLSELRVSQAFMTGVLHPLLGIDHFLVMLCFGFWVALLRGRALWLLPCLFLVMMIIGAGMPVLGITLATIEFWAALSVLACGAGLFWAHRQGVVAWLAALLTSVFAVSHGYEHAVETAPDLVGYISGFLLTSVLLQGLGILLCWRGG
ncbi:MAG: HupE/UreJ family protein [Methylomonas sp.]|nr:HupE/UreJ family protein [Methylomonas sp.]PPD19567.1 MAG: hypothetical protein CTY23_11485 [Methylomonas sp.]PPD24724.1 MAG: hypothetical protein CTY22_10815 [Methylomonas sp.]PPD33334.1 MAG: hypothetical protein CTY21_10795 [Methylomonas sp.]PPD38741.1 MAG: hypothetical protein CTY17_08935 [Methylomonas sp.]